MSFIGPIFLVVGVGLLLGFFFAFSRTRRFLASAQEARAEVIGIKASAGSSRDRAYYPVLRYRTQEGATKEVVSSVGSNPPRYKEGDSVVVLYDPAQPSDVRIHSFFNVWVGPLVLGALGVILTGVGVGLTLYRGD
ncbi:MAG TPA: DUF3592 domain-containing protein [Hyalangium sp.]|nr:DUF3592 domain-containing protein [Hyalangium sp.]